MDETHSLGASYLGEGRCAFVLWAPAAGRVEVHLVAPEDRVIPMNRGKRGYHHAIAGDIAPGALYLYRLDGKQEEQLTRGDFETSGIAGMDEEHGRVFYTSSEPGPLERHLYSVGLNGKGRRRLTPPRSRFPIPCSCRPRSASSQRK